MVNAKVFGDKQMDKPKILCSQSIKAGAWKAETD